MSINRSYIAAAVILVLVSGYFMAGAVFGSGADMTAAPEAQAQRVQVVTRMIDPQPRNARLVLRGRTDAWREVTVRAQTGGRVAETPLDEGAMAQEGDVLCRIEVNARRAALAQAEANLRAAQLEYDAARQLADRGHRAETQVAGREAARDAARAQVESARIELAQTNITAPFDGVLDQRLVEAGGYLAPGEPCGVMVQLDPIRIAAEVSERDVAAVAAGMPGSARLITGEQVSGAVHFVERRADPATRTFRVELLAENPDLSIRSGVTADIEIELESAPAHRVPASVLALNAEGVLGVRIVADRRVAFRPVDILADDGEEVWVAGLTGRVELIVEGQDFVAEGAEVGTIPAGLPDEDPA